jgi:glycosyltransferase involved in cell wall biosynthesis
MRRELRPFLDETFGDASIARSGLFAAPAVQRTWREFLANDDRREWSRVWSLAVLIDFVNRRAVAAPPLSTARAAVTITTPEAGSPSRRPRRRRTLLLAPEIFASDGGIPRILRTYLKALCELAEPSETVRLVALNDAVIDTQDLHRSANDRLTQVRVCSRKKGRFVRDALQLSRGVDRMVCGHVAQLPVAFAAKLLNPRLRYYAVAHGIEVWRPFTTLERIALRNATRVLCVSDYTRREMLRHISLPEGRAVVLHNGLDPSFEITAGAPLESDHPVILTVTRLASSERYKGVEHLIEAMPTVRTQFPTAVLRIIGRGDDLPRLHELSNRLGLGNAIEFLGYVDDRRMQAELRSCSLFALPSSREGFGLVFLEAMANGRPCLGVRAGGVPEVIGEETGILAEPGNTPAIAAACVDALRRQWDQAAILERARTFSYSRFKEELGAVLREGNTPAI